MNSNNYKNIKVFLNYAIEDKQRVLPLYQKLEEFGFKPWMDSHNLDAGEDWKDKILEQIKESDLFIACLSKQSIGKTSVVQQEIENAIKEKRNIIPLKLEECEPHPSLDRLHWIDFPSLEGFENLLKAVDKIMNKDNKVDQFYVSEIKDPDVEYFYSLINRDSHHEIINNILFKKNETGKDETEKKSTVCLSMGLSTGGQEHFWKGIERKFKKANKKYYQLKFDAFKDKDSKSCEDLLKRLFSFVSPSIPVPDGPVDGSLKAQISEKLYEKADSQTVVVVYTIYNLSKKELSKLALFWKEVLSRPHSGQIVVIFDFLYEKRSPLCFWKCTQKSAARYRGEFGLNFDGIKGVGIARLDCFDCIKQEDVRTFLKEKMKIDDRKIEDYIKARKIGMNEDPNKLYTEKMAPIIKERIPFLQEHYA